jgi:putative Mg2+ transporter-C (MgtC) family protein
LVSFAFGTTTGDTGRVAAQIVTGIGFLGAGVILHGRTAVSGITTAATIWATAAMGIVIGVGYLVAGFGLSLLMRAVLGSMEWWEIRSAGELETRTVEIVADPDGGKTQVRLDWLMEQFRMQAAWREIARNSDGTHRWRAQVQLPKHQRSEFLRELADLDQVREIHQAANDGSAMQ